MDSIAVFDQSIVDNASSLILPRLKGHIQNRKLCSIIE
jgi:hypothetical protein